jgi:hypothetical protein
MQLMIGIGMFKSSFTAAEKSPNHKFLKHLGLSLGQWMWLWLGFLALYVGSCGLKGLAKL